MTKNKLRVLFLDDEVYRHNGACSNRHTTPINKDVSYTICDHKSCTVYHVWHAQKAIDCLRSCEKFDVVFLDHDLGFGHGVPDHEVMNGHHVVLVLRDLPENLRPETVVVHTHNIVAGPQMVKQLQEDHYNVIRQAFHPLHYNFSN